MNEEAYVARRRESWRRLGELTERGATRPSKFSEEELREFLRLYRETSSDLATARTQTSNEGLIAYLNNLCAGAYGVIYRQPHRSLKRTLVQALEEMARNTRKLMPYIAIAALILFGSAFGAFYLSYSGRVPIELFMRAGYIDENARSWASGKFPGRGLDESLGATGGYLGNNPRAAIYTAALSAGSFGIISLYIIYFTGAEIGGLAALCAQSGHLDFLLSSLYPHGVPELSGLLVAGGVAFRIFWAMLSPGVYTRGESLRRAGKEIGIGLLTCILLMCIAAPIEGFFSFNPQIPGWLKMGVGTTEIVLWGLFWTYYGRSGDEAARMQEELEASRP